MKLSAVLEGFQVVPYNNSSLVNHHIDADNTDGLELIVISWKNEYGGDDCYQEFEDQEIQLDPEVPGGFLVTTIDDDDPVGFIALTEATKQHLGP